MDKKVDYYDDVIDACFVILSFPICVRQYAIGYNFSMECMMRVCTYRVWQLNVPP